MTDFQISQPVVIFDIEVSTGPDISVEVYPPAVIEVQEVGIQGPAGAGAGQSVVAGEALGGHRVVTAAGVYPTDLTLDQVFGITLGAAAPGSVAAIVTQGPMVELSWAWVAGAAIYAGVAGVLTQVEPVGPVKRVGTAITATQISVAVQPTIYRE